MTLDPHKKHLIIAVLGAGSVLFGFNQYEKHRERMADKQQAVADIVLKQKDAEIAKRDKEYADFKAEMLQEMQAIRTSKQAVTVLNPTLPTPVASQGVTKAELPAQIAQTLPGDANTHYTLFTDEQTIALAKNAAQCKIDQEGLRTCEQDKKDMKQQIEELAKANKDWQGMAVPRWSLKAAISRDRLGNTKFGGGIGYRFTKNFGMEVGAINDAGYVAAVINFGGTAKASRKDIVGAVVKATGK